MGNKKGDSKYDQKAKRDWNAAHPGEPWPGDTTGTTTMGSKNNDSSSSVAGDFQYSQMIDAMIAAQPKLLAAEQKYGPANIEQRLKNLRLALGGSESTTGPALYMEALRKADPAGMGMLDQLTQTANSDLALGGQLNANQNRLMNQSTRSGQAARGMGNGPSDVFSEMLAKMGYGDALQQQRQSNAMDINKVRLALGTRGTDVALGMGTGVGPALISNDFAGSLLGSVYGANTQSNIAAQNRRSQSPSFGGTNFGGGGGYGNQQQMVDYGGLNSGGQSSGTPYTDSLGGGLGYMGGQ